MSRFAVTIERIRAIEPHPNADAIELCVVGDYRSIAKKEQFAEGELAAYIPEGALLPEAVLRELGLWDEEGKVGKLAGPQGNRIKAIKLRGQLSQGLLLKSAACTLDPREGQDVTEQLGITKYEPPIPVEMAGEVFYAGNNLTVAFDVENIKRYPDLFVQDERVIITEKLHGTFTGIAILPMTQSNPQAFGRHKNVLIFSKGLGAQGLVFKNNERNANNLYVRATRKLVETIDALQENGRLVLDAPFFVLGETYGPGVQDLAYGKTLEFRIFAVVRGQRREAQRFACWSEVQGYAKNFFDTPTVPVLYDGPYSKEAVLEHTSGATTLGAGHIREGVVIVPALERMIEGVGRLCLKSVSDAYLLRKGATEFN